MKRTRYWALAILSIIAISICGCAPAISYHALPSISQEATSAPEACIFLAVDDAAHYNGIHNAIGIRNDSLYFEYNIYKKTDDSQDYQKYETIHISKKPHDLKAMFFPYRDKNGTINDRYIIKPISNNEELDAIPLTYYTTDSTYFTQIEHRSMESSKADTRLYNLILYVENVSK
ncbi:MAG: hypothetical protein J6W51_06750 [Fibrobacter sp.]|nr:hypothetical protein [Fibrobacter sp.]